MKSLAFLKGQFLNLFNIIRDSDISESGTILKSIFTYVYNAIRNSYVCQSITVSKGSKGILFMPEGNTTEVRERQFENI